MRSVRWGVRADLFFLFPAFLPPVLSPAKSLNFAFMSAKRLILVLCLISSLRGTGQIQYTRDFTARLRSAGLELSLPDSTWYKVHLPCEDVYNRYDLCLVSETDSADLKYLILDALQTNKIFSPQVHFMNKAANLATNADNQWMRTRSFNSRFIQDSLRADWAGELSFTPKLSITPRRYGKLFGIYREETGMAYVVLFYNHEFPGFNEHLHSVFFKFPRPDKAE